MSDSNKELKYLGVASAERIVEKIKSGLNDKQPKGDYALKSDIVQPDFTQNDSTAVDYIKNRTHWKETVQVPLNIEWDGNTDGRIAVTANGVTFYKVSDIILSDEELEECTVVVGSSEVVLADHPDEWIICGMSTVSNYGVGVVRNTEDNFDLTGGEPVYAPETGIYFVVESNGHFRNRLYSNTVTMDSFVYHKIDSGYLPDNVTPNLSQSDPSAPDYVKGRTHWKEEPITTAVLEETTLSSSESEIDLLGIEEGKTYTVVFDGVTYERVCRRKEAIVEGVKMYGFVIGNDALMGVGDDTGEPFYIADVYSMYVIAEDYKVPYQKCVFVFADTESHTISVSITTQNVHKLDWDYIGFSEDVQVPLDIQWDGEIGDRYNKSVMVENDKIQLVKVADCTLSIDELIGCNVEIYFKESDGTEGVDSTQLTESDVGYLVEGDESAIMAGYILIVNNPYYVFEEAGMILAETGIYFMKMYMDGTDVFVKRLHSDTTTVIKKVYNQIPDEALPKKALACADFEQTDPNGAGYIKGLDRYNNGEVIASADNVVNQQFVESPEELTLGEAYFVTFDNVDYEVIFKLYENSVGYLGNLGIGGIEVVTPEPFLLITFDSVVFNLIVQDENQHNIKISKKGEMVAKIPHKFIPDDISGLPDINTETDEKKILRIIDGVAVWDSEQEQELPDFVAETDEGKFLRIVDGVVSWATITNAEEASF